VGKRPLIVHPRNDFMFLATDMLFNVAAKWRYMFGDKSGVPIVARTIVGRGWGQGATHSQSLHATFGHFPGLYVAVPAFPDDAKGLLLSALQGGNPVVIIEHRALYEHEGPVPEAPVPVPFGQARVVREGTDVTIVGCSLMAFEALRAAELLAQHGISAEVVDPRTVRPLDEQTILASLRKTVHLVVADTSWPTYGFAAEVAAVAAEQGFQWLKSSVRRVALPDCPAPVSRPLEEAFHPGPATIARACLEILQRGTAETGSAQDIQEAFAGPY
jgi:pyruvate dehydrogenase E1 component beta subunit